MSLTVNLTHVIPRSRRADFLTLAHRQLFIGPILPEDRVRLLIRNLTIVEIQCWLKSNADPDDVYAANKKQVDDLVDTTIEGAAAVQKAMNDTQT